jgi:hypothetical protein
MAASQQFGGEALADAPRAARDHDAPAVFHEPILGHERAAGARPRRPVIGASKAWTSRVQARL